MKKITAMEAIRSGQQGERYKQKSLMYLGKSKKLPVACYLAANDILSNVKRYLVLILTFMIGTLLIILPLNAITSLSSDEMAKNFTIDTKANFYINGFTKEQDESSSYDSNYIEKTREEIKDTFAKKGYEVDSNILTYYSFSMYLDSKKDSYSVMTAVPDGSDGSYFQMTKGYFPKEKNEIALSENQAKRLNAKIGDTIHVKISDSYQDFIVSGLYQNFVHLGQSALLNEKFDLSGVKMTGYFAYQCYIKNMDMNLKLYDKIKKEFPQYKICNKQELMDSQLGSTGSQLLAMKKLIIVLVLAINLLITMLMTKIFILSEKNQIAILMSMGFSKGFIYRWQILRMGMVLCISVILGAFVSIPLNTLTLRPIFGMMGATHMVIQVNPAEVYLKYPFLLFVVICMATALSTRAIRKISLMEINHEGE